MGISRWGWGGLLVLGGAFAVGAASATRGEVGVLARPQDGGFEPLARISKVDPQPKVVLSNIGFPLTLEVAWLPAFLDNRNQSVRCVVQEAGSGTVLADAPVDALGDDGMLTKEVTVPEVVLTSGMHTLRVSIIGNCTGAVGTTASAGRGAGSASPSALLLHSAEEQAEAFEFSLRAIMPWLTLLPPILCVLVAILTRQVLLSLFVGVWLAATFAFDFNPIASFLRVADTYVLGELAEESKASVVLFTWLLGGISGLIQANGGTVGFVNSISGRVNSAFRAQLTTYWCGFAIFFDDYANSMIVGTAMKSLIETYHVSKEKFAFLVDTTAAPLASIAPISAWVGFELGLIDDALREVGDDSNVFSVFLESILSRYYPIGMLAFTLTIVLSERDFGPMRAAEQRAARERDQSADEEHMSGVVQDALSASSVAAARPSSAAPAPALQAPTPAWWKAVVPILSTVAAVVLGLVLSGIDAVDKNDALTRSASDVMGEADPFLSLVWGGLVGSAVALLCSIISWPGASSRSMTPKEALDAWVEGIKVFIEPTIVLLLAWSFGKAVQDIGLGTFLADSLADSADHRGLPAVVFILAAAISFFTGTSWGTMTLLMPTVIPLAYAASNGSRMILVSTISSVLSGAVFGDHCTLISDTTILSSTATGCEVDKHVATQLPYAFVVGLCSVFLGDFATGFGLYPDWIGLCLVVISAVGMVYLLGKTQQDPGEDVVTRCMEAFSAQWARLAASCPRTSSAGQRQHLLSR